MPDLYWDSGIRYDSGLRYPAGATVPTRMSNDYNSYPVNEVLGFADGVRQMLDTYKTQMIAAGVDPTALLPKLLADHTDLNTKNIAQEGLKTQLRAATQAVDASKVVAYDDASRGCDMLIGAFGKKSQQAKEATNLRKSIRPVKTTKTTPTPPPTP
jgi:hypothetical protein